MGFFFGYTIIDKLKLNRYNKYFIQANIFERMHMAIQIAQGPWVVMKTTDRQSRYGGDYTEVTMVNSKGTIAHTYVDPDNKNSKKWQEVIDLTERGWAIILDDLKYKTKDNEIVYKNKSREPLINADSKVKTVLIQKDKDQVLRRLCDVLDL